MTKQSIWALKRLSNLCLTAMGNLNKEMNPNVNKIEKHFQIELRKALSNSNLAFKYEVNLKDLDGEIFDPTRKTGRVDFVISENIGIEIKVINFPKIKIRRAECNSMYDLGQITMDAARLINARALKHGFIILLIHGSHLSAYSTRAELRRQIHNRLFVDYTNSSKIGRPFHNRSRQPRKYKTQYQEQSRVSKRLGFNTSFSKESPLNFAAVEFSGQLAVMIINVF